MNNGQRQVVAEKVSSTVRVLELLGFDYAVLPPKNKRKEVTPSDSCESRWVRIAEGLQ